MLPGESIDTVLILQNMDGTEDVRLKAELVAGGNIATLADEELEYLVPLGRKDINVNLKITIPEDAVQGERYAVGVSFKETPKEGEGEMLGTTAMITKNIPVQKVNQPSVNYSPQTEINYVLEVKAGYAEANNLQVGDLVEFNL